MQPQISTPTFWKNIARLGAWAFEFYSKNILSYPYSVVDTSSTVTTITYTRTGSNIIKTITDVSDTVTTIVLQNVPSWVLTTKTITENVDGSLSVTYS
jgi:hypothetical protein